MTASGNWSVPPRRHASPWTRKVIADTMRREFASVRLVAVFENRPGVSDDEEGTQIFVATGLKTTWARAWPAFRDYS